jgi:hypothetical protein
MRLLRNLGLGFFALMLIALSLIYATGNIRVLSLGWTVAFGGPSLPFDASTAVPAPDYSQSDSWAALPERAGVEDRVPAGVRDLNIQDSAEADVFFIHPTGYLAGDSWIYTMDPNSKAEENTQWMMANQASAYGGCCKIYAPRYRQANIFAYFRGDEIREQALGFAYQDVKRAFEYFLLHYNQGRPFVLASHSQGTHHGIRLLAEVIDGTPLAQRLVAAYVIGGTVPETSFEGLRDVRLCTGANDLGCAVHWDTYSEAVIDQPLPDNLGAVCTNPLSWELNGGLVTKEQHLGAVPASGRFQVELSGSQKSTGVVFEPLSAPIPNMIQAQCKDGVLFITDQSDTIFGEQGGSFGGGNYHGLDYPVFHMDIRENAKLRVQTFLARSLRTADLVVNSGGGRSP